MSGKADERVDRQADRAEAARVRRRWLTLGEILGIAAVVISALTFWNSYAERRSTESEHAADKAKSTKIAATLVLKAVPAKDGRVLALAPRADGQSIDAQTIRFPAALDLSPVETSGDARIERDWFAAALTKARHAAGLKDETGDARLPVLIETKYEAEGEALTARDTYMIGYAADSAFLTGTRIRLHGLSRIGSAREAAAGQKAIDAAWARQLEANQPSRP